MKLFLRISFLLTACFSLVIPANAAQVAGLVTDAATNLPLLNANIYAFTYDEKTGDSVLFDAGTGKDGYFVMTNMPAGVYNIWCQHPDYMRSPSITISLDENDPFTQNFALVLKTSGTCNHISGHVYSTPTLLTVIMPVADAKVWLTGGNGQIYETKTDNEGKYSFHNIAPGTYTVSASAEGYQPAIDVEKIAVEPDAQIEHLDINLIPLEPGVTHQLSGTVYDTETGSLLYPAFITVVLYDPALFASPLPPEHLGITVANKEDGTYLIEGIPAGKYDVICTARKYQKAVVEKVDFTQNNQVLDFYLKPVVPPFSNLLAGIVYDSDSGEILSDVQLSLTSIVPPGMERPVLLYQTRSDLQGYYQFYDIVADKYRLTAFKRGYDLYIDTLEIQETTWITNNDIKLQSFPATDRVTLWGHVWNNATDFMTAPVYPALIEVCGFNQNGDSLYYRGLNNPDGSYKIPGIIPGYYRLSCRARGYETEIFYRVPLFEPDVRFDFVLTPVVTPPLGTISGRVYFDETNGPVYKAQIHFIPLLSTQPGNTDSANIYRTYTNERGFYKANLPPGKYVVACRYQYANTTRTYSEYYDDVHSLSDATPVPIRADELTDGIDFGIPGPINTIRIGFTGRVTDEDGTALPRALVHVWQLILPTMRASIQSNIYSAYTDENGEYKILVTISTDLTFAPVPVYPFVAAAGKEGYKTEYFKEKSSIYEADLFWARGDTVFTGVDFTLEPIPGVNSVSGRVTGAAGLPISNAFVVGIPENGGELSLAFTNNEGNYTLQNLNQLRYYILFLANSYAPEFFDDATLWEDATPVLAEGAVTGIDAQLSPFKILVPHDSLGCMLAGRIMNQKGIPLEGALITVRDHESTMIGYGMTDNSGYYQIDGLSDGTYMLAISRVNFSSQTAEVEINSSRSDITLMDFSLADNLTSVPEHEPSRTNLPAQLALLPNYPNPFNPSTKIDFALPEAFTVNLSIYDILGRKIKTLVEKSLPPGRYSVTWNGSDASDRPVSSGIYFYVLETPGRRLAGKLILNR
jgi:protocatechuate 3,4-dioxygenase beta subunit